MDPKELNQLLNDALKGGPQAHATKEKLRGALHMDDSNFSYYFGLVEKARGQTKSEKIMIAEPGKSPAADQTLVYPLEDAPEKYRNRIQILDYTQIKAEAAQYEAASRTAVLEARNMLAGIGSSVDRTNFLAKKLGIPREKVKLGSKGVDLSVDLPPDPKQPGKTETLSIAEVKTMRLIRERGSYKDVVFQDIVGPDTRQMIQDVWKRPYFLDRSKSLEDVIRQTPGLEHAATPTVQAEVPTLDAIQQLSYNRVAPAGHGFFAIDALLKAISKDPPRAGLVAALTNGEDVSSLANPLLVGAVRKHEMPITLITTDKTGADVKGGILGVYPGAGDRPYLTVIETAQAEEAKQLDYFKKLPGCMSTNLTMFNYDALVPKLRRLLGDLDADIRRENSGLAESQIEAEKKSRFLQIISPDLIKNPKKQKDADGVERTYTQLEGAMGSSIMNLDREFRRRYNEGLVRIINVPQASRTEVFAPIKSAFDYFAQFHSDRYRLDPQTMKLTDNRHGEPLVADLKDKYYADVQNVLDAFHGASLQQLDALSIEGQVLLPNAALRGKVIIKNSTGQRVDLGPYLREHQSTLANVELTITLEDGKLKYQSSAI